MGVRLMAVFFLGSSFAWADDSRPGLVGSYTQYGERPNTSTTKRIDPVPALLLTVGESPVHDRASISKVAWVGTITIPTDGDYRFSFTAQNALGDVSIRLGDQRRIELRGSAFESNLNVNGDMTTIRAGTYPLRITVDYPQRKEPKFDVNAHPRFFAMRWSGPGFRDEPVPAAIFRHDPKSESSTNSGDLRMIERGQFLFRESQCLKCHQKTPNDEQQMIQSLSLASHDIGTIAHRTNTGWIDAWLANPKAIRPHTNMPAMFADTLQGRAERYAVTQFLWFLSDHLREDRDRPVRESKVDTAAIRRGERLFLRVGCAACHANTPGGETKPRNEDDDPAPAYDPKKAILSMGSPTGPQTTYALGAVGSKWNSEKLAEYLLAPSQWHSNSRMPSMGLSKAEAKDITAYLMTMKDAKIPTVPPKPELKPGELKLAAAKAEADAQEIAKVDAIREALKEKPFDNETKKWIQAGLSLFSSKGCNQCHNATPIAKKYPMISPDRIVKNPNSGCLSDTPSVEKTPRYDFSAEDRAALRAAVSTRSVFLQSVNMAAAETRYQLNRLMCLNCHDRDGEGGLAATMVDRMKTLATPADVDQIRPPSLTQIGHKATKTWLGEVITNGVRARPWMGLRMPQYGELQTPVFVHGLAALDGASAESNDVKSKIEPDLIAAGRMLTGKEGYGCTTCHDIAGIVGGGTRGPDLALTTKRIRSDWFDRWMQNPQRIQPGSKMPQYFLNGQATHAALGANPDKQIAALKAYFDLGPGLPLPTGLELPKGLLQVVTDRPVILRTFMPEGASTRAIAVGFPGGINIAYDPTYSRVAYLWNGPFLDMTPVWTGRGGQPAKVMGPIQWDNTYGRSWTTLDMKGSVGDSPWPDFRLPDTARFQSEEDKKAAERQVTKFVKYSVDEKGMPTFHSEMDGIAMSETIRPLTGSLAIGISRELTVTVPDTRTIWFSPGGGMSSQFRDDGNIHLSRADGKAVILKPIGSKFHPILQSSIGFSKGTSTFKMEQWILPRDDKRLIEEFLKSMKAVDR